MIDFKTASSRYFRLMGISILLGVQDRPIDPRALEDNELTDEITKVENLNIDVPEESLIKETWIQELILK